MKLTELTPGTPVEIEVVQSGETKNFNTAIAVIKGNNVLVDPLCGNGKILGFSQDCTSQLLWINDARVFGWKVLPTPVKYEGKIYHSVSSDLDAEPVNRRGAYRVFIGKEMFVTSFTANGPKSVQVLIKDISETGFAFVSKENYPVGSLVRLQLEVDSESTLRLTSNVVRMEDREDGQFLYGCHFADRNRHLSAFIMKYQQEKQKSKLSGKPDHSEEEKEHIHKPTNEKETHHN